MKLNDDQKHCCSYGSCLFRASEKSSAAAREKKNYDVLVERMKELGLKEEDYNFYLDLRRYGTNKHAGFGLGFERAVMYITGVSNIRRRYFRSQEQSVLPNINQDKNYSGF